MLGLCFSYDFQVVPVFGGPSLTVTEHECWESWAVLVILGSVGNSG